MNEIAPKNDIVDTTDCLEAITAFKSMKNFLFLIAILCLLITQLAFWANQLGYIDKTNCPCSQKIIPVPPVPALEPAPVTLQSTETGPVNLYTLAAVPDSPAGETTSDAPKEADVEKIVEVAEENASETTKALEETEKSADEMAEAIEVKDKPVEKAATGPKPKWSLGKFNKYIPKCTCVCSTVKVCNYLLLISVLLYSLMLLMCIKISLAGRLGGVNHISRAFFRSLFALVFVIPWQIFMPGVLVGAIYVPCALFGSTGLSPEATIFCKVLFFLRYCGLWLLVFLMLVSAQKRSAKWSKATLRRLGILH